MIARASASVTLRLRERRPVGGAVAGELGVDHRPLGREQVGLVDRLLRGEGQLLEQDARRVAGIAGEAREARDGVAADRAGVRDAAVGGGNVELALAQRRVEPGPGLGRTVAETLVAGPEPDARGRGDVGIGGDVRGEGRPAPRPDPASLNCVATAFAASASSLTISNQAAAGSSPARCPSPGELVSCISSAIRCEGIPIWVRWSTRLRRLCRIERLAAVGPSL